MIPLTHFNQLPPDEAARLLEPCVAIDSWVTALVQARPYPTLRRCTPWRSRRRWRGANRSWIWR
jgi:hypothetical protein